MQPQTRDNGAIAQLVEQRTENPCVPGSIPGGTTKRLLTFRKPLELEIVQGVFFTLATHLLHIIHLFLDNIHFFDDNLRITSHFSEDTTFLLYLSPTWKITKKYMTYINYVVIPRIFVNSIQNMVSIMTSS